MRLLYLTDLRFPMERANGIQTVETCHALARRGVKVTLVVRRSDERSDEEALAFFGLSPHERLEIRRLPVVRPGTRLGRLSFLARCLPLLARAASKWDVCYTRDPVFADVALRTKPLHGLPVYYEAHTVAAVFAEDRPAMYRRGEVSSPAKLARLDARERRVCRGVDGLVTITAALLDALRKRHGFSMRARVVPDGCRLPTPSPAPPRGRKGAKRVLYTGQLYPWKGVDRLIEAIALTEGVELVVIGGLPPEPDLERVKHRAEELGLSDRARFEGFLPPSELAGARADADIFAIPLLDSTTARLFTSPLKLFEAMASGRPTVASDLPSIREVLTHEENALLVPPGDADALAAAIARLARDDALSERLARQALEDVADYTWDRRAERIEAFVAPPRDPV